MIGSSGLKPNYLNPLRAALRAKIEREGWAAVIEETGFALSTLQTFLDPTSDPRASTVGRVADRLGYRLLSPQEIAGLPAPIRPRPGRPRKQRAS